MKYNPKSMQKIVTSLKLINDWESEYITINNLLLHLRRRTKSESSRQNYLGAIERFCRKNNVSPDVLVTWEKTKIEQAIQKYCDQYIDSKNSVSVIQACLTTFFFVNGFRSGKYCNLETTTYYKPPRYRKTVEHILSEDEIKKMISISGVSLRNRLIILMLYQSGLRNSTLRALRWDDINLDIPEDDPLLIKVTVDMKKIVPDACKNSLEYFTFIGKESIEALKLYKAETENRFGIKENQVIFMTNYKSYNKEFKRHKPITSRNLTFLIHITAKNIGLKNWKQVKTHGFRKSFERALRNSNLHSKDIEFLIGHRLNGSQDVYYDDSINELKEKYKTIQFFQEDIKLNGLRTELQKQHEEMINQKEQMNKQDKEIDKLRQALADESDDRNTHDYLKNKFEIDQEKWQKMERDYKNIIQIVTELKQNELNNKEKQK